MRRLLAILVLALLVLAGVWWLGNLPGVVVVRLGDITASARVPVAAIGLVLLFLLLYAIVRLLLGLVRLPRTLRRWRGRRRRALGDRAVTRALVALAAGEAGDARHHAGRALRLLGPVPQSLVLVAEAARLAALPGEAESAYGRLAADPEAAFLGLRGLIRSAIEREDWAQANALAARAEAAHPGAAWLRAERVRLAVRSQDWSAALALAGPEAPRAAFAAAAATAATDPSEGLRLARRAFEADPALAPAALAYAQRLRESGREGRALKVIRRAWSESPHPDLAEFALSTVVEPLARMRAAQELVAENPTHVESRFLLARAALAAGLTGEARRHAEAAAAGGLDQRRVWMLLAEIADAEAPEGGGVAASLAALRRAATAEPDPAWRCGVCGAEHASWHAACTNCGEAGSLNWRGPARSSAELLAPRLSGPAVQPE